MVFIHFVVIYVFRHTFIVCRNLLLSYNNFLQDFDLDTFCCSFVHEISFFELSKESLVRDSFSNFKLHRILFSMIVKNNFVFVHEMVIHVQPKERTRDWSRKRKFILERRSHRVDHTEGMLRGRVQSSRWGGDRETNEPGPAPLMGLKAEYKAKV